MGDVGEWRLPPLRKLFETMVYHTDRARRLALTSPLLLPERVPVVFSIRLFDPPFKRRVFLWALGNGGSRHLRPALATYSAASASPFAEGISQLSTSSCASSIPTRLSA